MRNAASLTEYLADDTLSLPPRIDVETAVREILDLHRRQGGATFSLYFGDSSGQPLFAVSVYPKRSRTALNEQTLRNVLNRFLQNNEDLLSDPRNCVGTWHVVETGQVIVDVSAILPDRSVAEEMGTRYNQIAIFDLKAEQEIVTGGMGVELEGWPPESDRLPPLKRGEPIDADQ